VLEFLDNEGKRVVVEVTGLMEGANREVEGRMVGVIDEDEEGD
jgi:hypothetical protein